MKRQSFSRRIILPIAVPMILMIISTNGYDLARDINNHSLHLALANTTAMVMFLSIWLGAMIANTIAFFQGATFKERLVVCLITPAAWSAKVWLSFLGIYSWPEFFFLLLHHIILGPLVVALLCMGISELWCRAIAKRRTGGASGRVLAPASLAVLVIGAAGLFIMLYNGGHAYYFVYMDLYTKLFM